MSTVGFTGHQNLPPAGVDYISSRLTEHLRSVPTPLVGLTSLAAGADQLFARLVLDLGGSLRVVIPSAEYVTTFQTDADMAGFHTLLRSTPDSRVLAFDTPSEEAFFAAGRAVVEESDELLAVWDGLPARGFGGTADVVRYAEKQGRPVTVVWPAGLRR
ncbi:hypothetical protein I6A60_26715 [Frankia sp. AgB1.9]|uniref:hypothetical protein n=1 Tax=unclassified Frankia TaxID=2632575 RepID=UPI001931B00B|nr:MULTISPECIES: hypothetical protein [unclassified Frankia]MBL7488598.1 hypothetical protein [Frankia sp. AgW1.1]MBL7551424.1 hypothetical protein [Frankia sp. AgB1.9]MBL7622677.1 hypothetical protein [Frankia sp. AgB1.8]